MEARQPMVNSTDRHTDTGWNANLKMKIPHPSHWCQEGFTIKRGYVGGFLRLIIRWWARPLKFLSPSTGSQSKLKITNSPKLWWRRSLTCGLYFTNAETASRPHYPPPSLPTPRTAERIDDSKSGFRDSRAASLARLLLLTKLSAFHGAIAGKTKVVSCQIIVLTQVTLSLSSDSWPIWQQENTFLNPRETPWILVASLTDSDAVVGYYE